jgi:toxic protein SymE
MMAVDGNNITSEPGVEEASLHRIKVSYATRHSDHVPVPALNLKGKWLEAAGFPTGAEADIRVMAGCLVITARPAAREPEEPELMKALRKVCKLSARKQKQVQEFISVVTGSAARK